jgi:hypothetical protein
MTVEEIYQKSIKHLSTGDRLRLATTILKDIPPQAVVDYSEEWNEEDLEDFTKQSWVHVESTVEKDEHA